MSGHTEGSLGGLSAGRFDAWFAHYDEAGNRLWICQLGTSHDDYGGATAADATGGLFVCGQTLGSLGGPSAGQVDTWLARYEDACPQPSTYCAAKTTSTGCTPAIGHTGLPSATAPSGFSVIATQIEPDRPGILFFGLTGPDALPFQGGLLCVRPPIHRTPTQSSGASGSQPCTGVLALDLNATGVCASIGVGHHGWMQGWSRDPASPSGTGLTDAIEWKVCP